MAKTLDDQSFLLAHLTDYSSDSLSSADRQRYQSLLNNPDQKDLVQNAQTAVGKLQLAFQSHYLTEDQRVKLHEIVEDAELRRTREVERIEQVGRWEALGDFRRRVIILGIVASMILAVVYYFTPEKKTPFDPLAYLSYEALAMEEDPEGRLDYPSDSEEQVAEYINSYKGLTFSPRMLAGTPSGWRIEGATVLDYETAKVVAIKYKRAKSSETFFHFLFRGKLASLPPSDQGNMANLVYQTYASDRLNLIAWEAEADVVNMLVGRDSAPELARMASGG